MPDVLVTLAAAVAAVPQLPCPAGLGAEEVFSRQVHILTEALVVLQRELALRMTALETQGTALDVRGDCGRAGLGHNQTARLCRLGRFTTEHDSIRTAWTSGTITIDHVEALRSGTGKLPTPALRGSLIGQVLPHLPGLSAKHARRLIEYTADHLDPGDPDHQELSDYAARSLTWSRTPGGGIAFQGYLPDTEAGAFTCAINALANDLRIKGDGLTPGQRRADALAALVARAIENGVPTGGGLPAALTLTVSFTEAERIAARDPAHQGTLFAARPRGGSTLDGRPTGDAAVRFGICCGAVTPVLAPDPPPGSPLARLANTPVEPLAVGRAVRLATPAQRRALSLRDDGCAITGCGVVVDYTQPHHVRPWAMDGPTDLGNLVSVCFVHHRQVELGKYTFIPRQPGEPRPEGALEHPRWWIVPPRR